MLSDRCPVCPFLSVCNVGVLWPNGWMDQDATALGTEVNLGPGDVVLDGVPVPPKSAQPSSFRPMSIVTTAALQLLLSSCLLWRCSSSSRVPQKIAFPDNTGAVDFYRPDTLHVAHKPTTSNRREGRQSATKVTTSMACLGLQITFGVREYRKVYHYTPYVFTVNHSFHV